MRVGVFLLVASLLCSCSTQYVTPGKPVDFAAFTEPSVKKSFEAKPAVTFPASVVAVRVQGEKYRNHAINGYGTGRDTVVTTREIEEEQDFDVLRNQPDSRPKKRPFRS